jgi:hypothetical protein
MLSLLRSFQVHLAHCAPILQNHHSTSPIRSPVGLGVIRCNDAEGASHLEYLEQCEISNLHAFIPVRRFDSRRLHQQFLCLDISALRQVRAETRVSAPHSGLAQPQPTPKASASYRTRPRVCRYSSGTPLRACFLPIEQRPHYLQGLPVRVLSITFRRSFSSTERGNIPICRPKQADKLHVCILAMLISRNSSFSA